MEYTSACFLFFNFSALSNDKATYLLMQTEADLPY